MDKQTLDFITHYALTCYNYSGDCKEEKIIASLIYSYMQGARILDMGCGPVSPILAQFFPEATDLVAFDKLPENIAFMQKYSDRISHIISQAAEYRLDTFGSKPPVLHSVEYFV